MNVIKRLRIWIAVLAMALVAGVGISGVAQVVKTPQASADVVATYVASTSAHNVRGCDGFGGLGVCQNRAPGKWFSLIGIGSIQVDRGCELFSHGHRVAKRKNYDYWHNFYFFESKATVRLSNCQ